MAMECPHCKHPTSNKRKFFGSHIWAKWDCQRCGSKLAFNKTRRVIIGLAFGAIAMPLPLLTTKIITSPMGLLGIALCLLALCPIFLFLWWRLEQLVVLERRGLFCTECGYDLTGNQSGQCPECGKKLPVADPADPS